MAEFSSTADLERASVYISYIQVDDSISIRIKYAEEDANLLSFLDELANQVNLTLNSYASDPDPDTVVPFSDDTWSAKGLTDLFSESPNDLKEEYQSDREPDKSEVDTHFPEKSTQVVEQGHGDHKERPDNQDGHFKDGHYYRNIQIAPGCKYHEGNITDIKDFKEFFGRQ
ncbi:MAG: hypothetical protein ASARMPRED_001380 [Alectoria sarmentosa]|nr:MAG: hypothetical protein ASARMPRED_001380 [Alectoria sarmentosa]